MLGKRLGKWGGQLLGVAFIGLGLLAPGWPKKALLVGFGAVYVVFERWRAPDSVERAELERQRQRDERRRRGG